MATISVIKSASGQSVYADGAHGGRALLGYIDGKNTFFAARAESEQFHKQRWSDHLKRALEDQWLGKEIAS